MAEVLPTQLLSFRITHPKIASLNEFYKVQVENYLKTLGYGILSATGGLHKECETPHVHFHYVVDTTDKKVPKVFIQDWKYKWKSGKCKVLGNWDYLEHVCLKAPCLHSTLHKSKINISIKFSSISPPTSSILNHDTKIQRFLRYPFKEGIVVFSTLDDQETGRLTAFAQAEWIVTKQSLEKRLKERENTATEYGKICKLLEELKPETYKDALVYALKHVRDTRTEQKDHINPKFIVGYVQKYCFHYSVSSIAEIAEKYGRL